MIHVIPGFLGSSDDFEFLSKRFDIICHDLRKVRVDEIQQLVGLKDILLGYSLGGRLSLEIAQRCEFKIKKLILLAAHPGLEIPEERVTRRNWEDDVLRRMKERSTFLEWWNALPIFEHDLPLRPRELAGWSEVFDANRLSAQQDFRAEMLQNNQKIIYLYGQRDEKFSVIARDLSLLGIRTIEIPSAGHRLFTEHEAILEILNQEIT